MKIKRNLIWVFMLTFIFIGSYSGNNALGAIDTVQNVPGEKAYVTSTWVSPFADEQELEASAVQTRTVNSEQSVNEVSSYEDLEELITEELYARNTSFQLSFTGDMYNFEEKFKEILNRIYTRDDYLQFSIKEYSYRGCGNDFTFTFSYWTTKEEENYVDQEVSRILADIIRPDMIDDEKEAAIHDYIITNVAYDESMERHSAYAALHDGTTVCQGYALLTYKMLTEVGIESRIISGDAPGPHAWNLVKIDDKWYHLDCTFDDPLPDQAGRICYTYYNLSRLEISRNHDWNRDAYPETNTAYIDALLERIDNNPGQAEVLNNIIVAVELQYTQDEYTAHSRAELGEMIQQSLLRQEAVFKIRTLAGVYEAYDLSDIWNYENAPSHINCKYSEYARTLEEGDLLVEISFTYEKEIKDIVINSTEVQLTKGETYHIQILANYTDNSSKDISAYALYESSNADIAAVDENGVIHARAAGESRITAEYGGQSREITVKVSAEEDPFSGLTWTKEEAVVPGYVWTINFSRAVKETSLSANIYVLNSAGEGIKINTPVKEGSKGKEVLVQGPAAGYTPGEYWLYVNKDIQSNAGEILKEAVRMKFNVD